MHWCPKWFPTPHPQIQASAVKHPPGCRRCRRPGFNPWIGKTPWIKKFYWNIVNCQGFSGGASGKVSAWQCRWGFDPRIRQIPWRRAWQSTLVFLLGNILWTEEPDGLQSIASQRVRHNWSDLTHTHTVNWQCCVSFRYIAKWISYNIKSFKDLFPLQVITWYWV